MSGGAFRGMSESAGPFEAVAGDRRTGCADEYWFTPLEDASQSVVFRISHRSANQPLTVHAALAHIPPPRDARTFRVGALEIDAVMHATNDRAVSS